MAFIPPILRFGLGEGKINGVVSALLPQYLGQQKCGLLLFPSNNGTKVDRKCLEIPSLAARLPGAYILTKIGSYSQFRLVIRKQTSARRGALTFVFGGLTGLPSGCDVCSLSHSPKENNIVNPKTQEQGSKLSAATVSGVVDVVWEELSELSQEELDRLENAARSHIQGGNPARVSSLA
jgi:hypothetical protein